MVDVIFGRANVFLPSPPKRVPNNENNAGF